MTETPQERFTRVNKPRVQKILDMLGTIRGSAASNGTTADNLLAPVRAAAGPIEPILPPGVSTPEPAGKSHWNDVIEMARNVPLDDAVVAMQIIATRVEQELFEQGTCKR